MTGTWAFFLCSVLLVAAEIQAQLTYGKGRCSCIGKGSDVIQQKYLEKIEVIPKSSSCEYVEIIATLKLTGEKICLNPNSKWVQKMMRAIIKKRSARSTRQ